MQELTHIFQQLSDIIWGPITLTLLVGTGVYLTLRLTFLQFRLLPLALKQVFMPHPKTDKKQEGDISHFSALMTALSATIGTGNIAGVATAVVAGGPGAVFWMWITAVFGMATKYAEAILAVKYRTTDKNGEMCGGPMYYIEHGLKGKWGMNWKWLAVIFAIFGMIASFGIGSTVQANSVAGTLATSFHIPTWVTGLVLMILTALVVFGGIRSIATASTFIVPIMAVFYVLGGLAILILHYEMVGDAFMLIMRDAFTGEALGGGVLGTAIRYGVARGVFSNEAGMGSAPIAAAAAKTDHAGRQALVSMTGTFLDTIVVCSITGLVLVVGYIMADNSFGEVSGAALTTETFNRLIPGPGGWIISIGMIFFAYSTTLGWSYYGEKCSGYLFGIGITRAYRFIYVITVFLGAVVSLDLVWLAADIFNGLMALPNLIALLLLSGVVVAESRDFAAKRKSGELY